MISTIQASNIREKIIQIISNSNSLTAKQVHLRLQREYAISNSYQATHKTLKAMVEEQILLKNQKGYGLNPIWVTNFKKSAEQLSEKVLGGLQDINLKYLKENESVHLSFKGILEVGWFLIDKIMDMQNPSKKPCLALWRFCYSIVGLEAKHLDGLKSAFAKNNWFCFVEEDNKVDHMFGETLLSYGAKKLKYGVKCATPLSDKMVAGDYIVEIIYPSTFRKIWALQNRLPVKVVEFNLAFHLSLMRELQPKIEVIVTKNSNLADEFRKEYLGKG